VSLDLKTGRLRSPWILITARATPQAPYRASGLVRWGMSGTVTSGINPSLLEPTADIEQVGWMRTSREGLAGAAIRCCELAMHETVPHHVTRRDSRFERLII
jgi:hypothetical protein